MDWFRLTKGFSLSLVFLLLFVYLISGTKLFFDFPSLDKNKDLLLGDISNSLENLEADNTVEPIANLEIDAKAAISVESNLLDFNKIIFEKNSNEKLPIASLTKLMSAIIVLDKYNLSKIIVIDKAADSQPPMKQDVKFGDKLSVESLLKIMLIKSSNKSAYALSSVIGQQNFAALMNSKAKELGLMDTFFADSTGLSPENISTVKDLSKLAEYILKNYPKIADISKSQESDIPGFGKVVNTDQLLAEIPEVVCGKTGFTIEARGCLLLAINNPKNNNYLINVILGADDRFLEMKKLINWSTNLSCDN